MASLGNALVTKILGHSAAEKAFRPWWDNFEDFLVYGLVMLGLVVAPTAIINGTPLDCTLCQGSNCKFADHNVTAIEDDPQFSAWWVKKFCTMTAVEGFILYFPYILLIMALVMVLIERGFVRAFNTGLKLDTFYNLLVKEGDKREETTTVQGNSSSTSPESLVDLEDARGTIEVSHSFSSSSNYFLSYVVRTVSEFVVALLLLSWLGISGVPSIQRERFILCDVYGYDYECAGHPQQFYVYVLFVAILILVMYLMCSFYNLMWLAFPDMGVLGAVMAKYRRKLRQSGGNLSDKELLGDLHEIYYNNRDLRLLLDLLATSSGIAPSLRILALFDKNLRFKIEPGNVVVSKVDDGGDDEQADGKVYDVTVEFEDAEAIRDIFSTIKNVSHLYTVELLPPTSRSSVRSIRAGDDGTADLSPFRGKSSNHGDVIFAPNLEMQPLEEGKPKKAPTKMRVTLYGLDACKDYTVRVCTIVNGRTIARKIERIQPRSH